MSEPVYDGVPFMERKFGVIVAELEKIIGHERDNHCDICSYLLLSAGCASPPLPEGNLILSFFRNSFTRSSQL